MSETTPYHCDECNETVRFKRREWDNHLVVGCGCETRPVKVGRKTPEEWDV